MGIIINLDPELAERLTQRARACGSSLDQYVETILRDALVCSEKVKPRAPYKNLAFSMGQPVSEGINLDKALSLSFSLDDNKY
ncbi:MAG: hypothetical protein KC940_03020 [Candidatus Omnitrophica bacterium]|nr:hypothetical protein [Candidatus Omnitrophota bacterium]MCA9442118.1 hypothetical protein [Candidatus Omnitrophota bacterium]MCB9770507.1 hypothetical protein [Candidatus Omnitrophota bacterium]